MRFRSDQRVSVTEGVSSRLDWPTKGVFLLRQSRWRSGTVGCFSCRCGFGWREEVRGFREEGSWTGRLSVEVMNGLVWRLEKREGENWKFYRRVVGVPCEGEESYCVLLQVQTVDGYRGWSKKRGPED